ncbi:MAG TPA: hypothetical protein VHO95_13065, partial [Candidatus Dormibacteraeota bacterium]|nr:hypothetical protein [Candidatus Dormibacteraeota bacterium]
TGLAVFNSTLYVADTGNALVRSVFVGGGPITTFAGNGTLSFSGDGGPAASAEMGIPYAIALDSSGNQYIADSQNNLVRKVDVTGTIMSLGANAGLKNPRGVAVDASGAVYVSDTKNQRVIRIAPGGGVTIMAMGLNRPRGLALDAQGHLFIADTGNNRVVEVTSPGVVTVVAGNGQLNGPRALAFDSQGNLFISDSDSNRIRELSNGVLTTIAGTGVAGAAGDGGPATSAQLNFPFGLGFDGAGNLYIADTGNNRLRVIQHGIITTVVGVCGGVSGFSGDGGLASTAQLNVPYGIAVDSAGDVYVADAFNNRIRGASAITGLRGGTCQSPPTGKGGGSRLIDLGPGPRLASSTQPSSTVKPAAPTRLIHPSAGSPVTAPSRVVPPAAQSHAANVPPAEVAAPSHSARAPVMSRMATPAPQNPMYASALGAVPLLCVALFALVRWRRRRL